MFFGGLLRLRNIITDNQNLGNDRFRFAELDVLAYFPVKNQKQKSISLKMEHVISENSTTIVNVSTDWLEHARFEIFVNLLLGICCMAVLGFVGIVGNALTICFYWQEAKLSPSKIQITWLAVVDLMVCVLIFPNILEIVTNVAHRFRLLCKLAHFFGYWTIAASSLTLLVVAVERYRKICKPFGTQMTIFSTFCALFGSAIFSLLLSIRDLFYFELVPVNTTAAGNNKTISGRMCTTTSDPNYKTGMLLFYGLDAMLVVTCWITIIVTYSQIALVLFRLNIKQQTRRSKKTNNTSHTIETECSTKKRCQNSLDIRKEDNDVIETCPVSVLDTTISGTEKSSRWTDTLKRRMKLRKDTKIKNPAESVSERTITLMMLAVSIGFIVCLLPFYIVKVSHMLLGLEAVHELKTGIQFALRLVYVNSVLNPVVYCCFNPSFRQFIISKLTRRLCRRKD